MFSFIKGEAQMTLQSSGWGTCALPFNTGFVTIGGFSKRDYHGKVDRCSNHNPIWGGVKRLNLFISMLAVQLAQK